MPKRWRRIKAKPGELKAAYGRNSDGELGITLAWGEGTSKGDTWLLYVAFYSEQHYALSGAIDPYLIKELEKRGYDLTTLKFSVQKKAKTDD